TAGEVDDRDVVSAFVRHVGGVPVGAGGDPVGRSAHHDGAADGMAYGVQDLQLARPLADDQAHVSIGCKQRMMGRSANWDLTDDLVAPRLQHLDRVHASQREVEPLAIRAQVERARRLVQQYLANLHLPREVQDDEGGGPLLLGAYVGYASVRA